MMTILGNKWYALKGCYLVIFLTAVCSSLSPYIGHSIAMNIVGASVFGRVTLDKPVGSATGSLGEAILWAVGPLAAASYLLQLVTLRFFNSDILTFKGHGNMLPDGSRTGTSASTHRVPVSKLTQIRRVASEAYERAGGDGADSKLKASEQGPDIDLMECGSQRSSNAADERRSEAAASSKAVSRVGSMGCSDHVSEIEQQILFNILDRVGYSLPDDVRSRSSVAGASASGMTGQRDPGMVLLRAASELSHSISEASSESESSDDSVANAANAAGAAGAAEVSNVEGGESDDAGSPIKLGGVCSI
eukprot:CAMPEP_0115378870 /NCGR_PEP_ID=MMETSP0271-20121206/4238_1 /TAXON_ID=71861 /ORGANISM="Scrippsiella trochoidea, Strain CCMP3099" /LENGTH=304 /DNA_ID=CAMNT_0002802053 /DNA_START=1 /DNA_END=915 /DNA_ORIENTATION=-